MTLDLRTATTHHLLRVLRGKLIAHEVAANDAARFARGAREIVGALAGRVTETERHVPRPDPKKGAEKTQGKKPKKRPRRNRLNPNTLALLRDLASRGNGPKAVAAELNRRRSRTARGHEWTGSLVSATLSVYGKEATP